MGSNEKQIDVNKVLPSYLVIKSAGSDLYRIGLSLFPFGSQKRKRLYNPLYIIILDLIHVIKIIISLLTNDDNNSLFLYIGDFAYFIDKESRIHLYRAMIFCIFIMFNSQLINFWYYNKDIKPSYLKPFEMMSGLVSPQSIGIRNKEVVYKLLNKSKILFSITRIISISVAFCGALLALKLLFSNQSLIELIFISIPWVLIISYFCNLGSNIIVYQILYFDIICYYFKLKMKTINNEIDY